MANCRVIYLAQPPAEITVVVESGRYVIRAGREEVFPGDVGNACLDLNRAEGRQSFMVTYLQDKRPKVDIQETVEEVVEEEVPVIKKAKKKVLAVPDKKPKTGLMPKKKKRIVYD
jgi:hypothetical protein